MYQYIYDFINNNLIGEVTTTSEYIGQLTEILTHVSIVLLFIVLILFIKGCFNALGGFFKWWQ